jgi:hypothetical protein
VEVFAAFLCMYFATVLQIKPTYFRFDLADAFVIVINASFKRNELKRYLSFLISFYFVKAVSATANEI